MDQVLCELREGIHQAWHAGKGLVEELLIFELGLLKDVEELDRREEECSRQGHSLSKRQAVSM